jgi:hypothetical protein
MMRRRKRRKVEGVHQIADAEELLVWVIGGHAQKLHMRGDNGDGLEDDSTRSHVDRIHRGDCSNGYGRDFGHSIDTCCLASA